MAKAKSEKEAAAAKTEAGRSMPYSNPVYESAPGVNTDGLAGATRLSTEHDLGVGTPPATPIFFMPPSPAFENGRTFDRNNSFC